MQVPKRSAIATIARLRTARERPVDHPTRLRLVAVRKAHGHRRGSRQWMDGLPGPGVTGEMPQACRWALVRLQADCAARPAMPVMI